MSEYLGSAILEVGANLAPLRAGLLEAERMSAASMRRMQMEQSSVMAASSARLSSLGSAMTRTMTVPILGLMGATTHMAVNFDRAMELVHTQAGASQREVDKLKGSVLELSKVVPYGPTKLAEALYHLESIGSRLHPQMQRLHERMRPLPPVMDALKVAAEGAAVGNANLEATTTALGSAFLVGIKGAGTLHQTMGTLNAAVGVGNMRMDDLVTALGTGLLPMAKLAGLSLQDALGALAVFSDEGYKASSAATQMSTALHYLYAPTDKASKALGTIGMNSTQMAADMRKPKGLLVALGDLRDHLDKAFPAGRKLSKDELTSRTESLRKELEKAGVSGKALDDQLASYRKKLETKGYGAVRQEEILGDIFPAGRGRVMTVLMNQLDRYDMKLGQITRRQDTFQEDVQRTMEQPAVRIQQAWSALQSDLTSFGEKVGPSLIGVGTKVMGWVDHAIDGFNKLPKGVQHAITTGGLILAGIGPAMRIIGFFTSGLTRLWGVAQIAQRLASGQSLRQARAGAMAISNMSVANMEVGSMIVKGMAGGPGSVVAGPGGKGGGPMFVPPLGSPPTGPYAGGTRLGRFLRGSGLRGMSEAELASMSLPPGAPTVVQDPSTGRFRALTAAERAAVVSGYTPLTGTERVAGGAARFGRGLATGGRRLAGGLGTGMMVALGGQALGAITGSKAISSASTYAAGGAMLGSMFGPEGTLIGGIGGAIVGGLAQLFHSKSFEEKLSESFGKGDFIGKAITDSQRRAQGESKKLTDKAAKDLAAPLTPAELDTSAQRRFKAYIDSHKEGSYDTGRGSEFYRLYLATRQQKDLGVGGTLAKAGETELQTYKHIDPASVSQDFIHRFSGPHVTDAMRQGGAEALAAWVEGMQKKGQLPKHSLEQIFGSLTSAFPGLKKQFAEAGVSSSNALAYGLKRDAAIRANQNVIATIASQWSGMPKLVDNDAKHMVQNIATEMDFLHGVVVSSTGKTKQDALDQLKALRQGADKQFTNMGHATDASMKALAISIRSGSAQAAHTAKTNFGHLRDSVTAAMQSGVIATAKGSKMIGDALNTLLKAFGAKPIPLTGGLSNKQLGVLAGEVASGQISPDQASTAGQLPANKAERGGMWQFGMSGDRGRDNIPVNFGGVPVVVGSGEVGAVFTGQQQQVADYFLSPIGGLDGLFSNFSQPHWAGYARGGKVDAVGPYHHRYPRHIGGSGTTLPSRIVRAIAEAVGFSPGQAYQADEIAHGESGRQPGMQQPDPGDGNIGYGLWQNTPHVWGSGSAAEAHMNSLGGIPAMFDPVLNAEMAYYLFSKASHTFSPWSGTRYLTAAPQGIHSIYSGDHIRGGSAGGGQVKVPHVDGTGTMAIIANAALGKVGKAANALLARTAPAGGLGGGAGGAVSTDGLVPRVLRALAWARAHGWHGSVQSGFRSVAKQQYLWDNAAALGLIRGVSVAPPGSSRHNFGQAVDVTDIAAFAAAMRTAPPNAKLYPRGPTDPVHFSVDGHARGGWVGAQTGLSPSSYLSHKLKTKVTKAPRHKSHATKRLPRLRSPKDFDVSEIARLANIDTAVNEFSSWQGFIQSLHGQIPYTASFTDAAGNETINWGIKDGVKSPRKLTGAIDPQTGQISKSIYDRVREIGDRKDRVPLHQRDLDATELGLDETMLAQMVHEQTLAQGLWGKFGPWLKSERKTLGKDQAMDDWLTKAIEPTYPYKYLPNISFSPLGTHGYKWTPAGILAVRQTVGWGPTVREKAREYKNAIARLLRTRLKAGFLTTERRHANDALTRRYTLLRNRIRTGEIRSSGALAGAHDSALSSTEREALRGVPTTAPHGWQGDVKSWSDQRSAEVDQIRSDFSARRAAAAAAIRGRKLSAHLSYSEALQALGLQESAERSSVADKFDEKSRLGRQKVTKLENLRNTDAQWLRNLLKRVRGIETNARQNVSAGLTQGGIRDQIKAYLDPMGTLAISIAEKRNIDIPALLREKDQLLGTHTTTSGTPSGGGGDTRSSDLLQQQVTMLGQQLAVSQAQYKVLSNLPPFGGSFAAGGIVPGPTGAARMILAHGGEGITRVEDMGKAPVIYLVVEDGAVNADRIKVIANGEAVKVSRTSVRMAGRGLPSRGGGA